MMEVLITAADNATYARYFPFFLLDALRKNGEVIRTPYDRSLTADDCVHFCLIRIFYLHIGERRSWMHKYRQLANDTSCD